MKKTECEIISHGCHYADYFQGCGSGSFSEVVTGCGQNEKDAYEDACEQAYMSFGSLNLPVRPRGINAKNRVPKRFSNEGDDLNIYVSIRFNP